MKLQSLVRRAGFWLAFGLLAGCGADGDGVAPAVAPAVPAAVVVGPAGGTVTGPDGVRLDVPEGALASDTTLQIVATDAGSSLPLPAGVQVGPRMYALLPHGTVFSVPVTLTVPREAGEGDDVSLLKTNGDGSAWEQLVTDHTDTAYSALITGFSTSAKMCGAGCGSPLPDPPVISMQPAGGSVDEGGYVLIGVSAIGAQPLRYQWRDNRGGVLPGQTSSAFVINPVAYADDGLVLRVTVTDRHGQSVTSNPAAVRVRPGPPVIVSQPLDLQAIAGSTALLSAASTSSVPQDMWWERFDPVSGQWGAAGSTTARLNVPNVQVPTHDGALFRFVARNTGGTVTVTSRSAVLTVLPAQAQPVIVDGPQDLATVAGRSAGFSVAATGGGLSYQWQRRDALNQWQPVGTDSAGLVLSNTTLADDGAAFRVVVSNTMGSAVSRVAQLSVPSTAGVNALRLGGGAGHSLGLRADGSLMAWGDNRNGELGRGTRSENGGPEAVAGLTGVATFAAGLRHTLAIRADGSLFAWGNNEMAMLGTGRGDIEPRPVAITGFNAPVRFVAAARRSSMAIAAQGRYWSWGLSHHGDGRGDIRGAPSEIAGHPFVRLAIGGDPASYSHNLGLRGDGSVWAWGRNRWGELGFDSLTASVEPRPVTGVSQVIALAAGDNHSLALTADGTLYAWGRNEAGQVGSGSGNPREPAPVRVALPGIVVGIAAGQHHSMALLYDGRVFAWGQNDEGQLGNGVALASPTPIAVSGLGSSPIVSIGAGERHSLALDRDGNVWGWGANDRRQLGDLGALGSNRPRQLPGLNLN
jgi:alpha-tubulin suppressor-like RCC1 family protein